MAEWDRAYKAAWQRYYTIEHIETVLRRVAVTKANASNALFLLTWFKGSIDFEHIIRWEGSPSAPEIPPRPPARGCRSSRLCSFYPRNTSPRTLVWARSCAGPHCTSRLQQISMRIKHDPRRFQYMDLALTPVTDDEVPRPRAVPLAGPRRLMWARSSTSTNSGAPWQAPHARRPSRSCHWPPIDARRAQERRAQDEGRWP